MLFMDEVAAAVCPSRDILPTAGLMLPGAVTGADSPYASPTTLQQSPQNKVQTVNNCHRLWMALKH